MRMRRRKMRRRRKRRRRCCPVYFLWDGEVGRRRSGEKSWSAIFFN
jgi:hypothetical protein